MRKITIFLSFILLATAVKADVISISAKGELNKLLADKKGEVLLSKSCSYICKEPIGKDQMCPIIGPRIQSKDGVETQILVANKNVNWGGCCAGWTQCTDVKGNLSIDGSANVGFSKIDFGDAVITAAPLKTYVRQIVYKNCSNTMQSASETITLSARRQENFTFQKSVSDGTSRRVDVKAQWSWSPGSSAGGGVSYTVDHRVTVTNGEQQSFSETIQRTSSTPVKVPPMSRVLFQAVMTENEANLPFTVDLIANGKLKRNLVNFNHASDVLSSDERNIEIKGNLQAIGVSGLVVETIEEPLTPNECAGEDGFKITQDSNFEFDKMESADL